MDSLKRLQRLVLAQSAEKNFGGLDAVKIEQQEEEANEFPSCWSTLCAKSAASVGIGKKSDEEDAAAKATEVGSDGNVYDIGAKIMNPMGLGDDDESDDDYR